MLATAAFRIADAFERDGADASAEWEKIAVIIVHTGEDPNWRTRRSIRVRSKKGAEG